MPRRIPSTNLVTTARRTYCSAWATDVEPRPPAERRHQGVLDQVLRVVARPDEQHRPGDEPLVALVDHLLEHRLPAPASRPLLDSWKENDALPGRVGGNRRPATLQRAFLARRMSAHAVPVDSAPTPALDDAPGCEDVRVQVIADLRALWPLRDFRKLFAVRLVSQAADGMFQVGLATLFFFSPEKASTASGVAIAFAVLLLPFTIVGPWAGVLLDRWRRRQVLFVGNLVRVGLTATIAIIMLTAGVTPAVYVLALVNLSVNRFLLSALSASLPRTVDGPLLLTANSLTPTLGAAAAGLGGAIGLVLGFVLPEGRGRDATALIVAACVMAAAAAAVHPAGQGPAGSRRARQRRPAARAARPDLPRLRRRREVPDRAPHAGARARHHGRAPVPLRRHVHREHPHRAQPAQRPGRTRATGSRRSRRSSARRRSGSSCRSSSPPSSRGAPDPRCGSSCACCSPRPASCCSRRRRPAAVVLTAALLLGLAAQGAKIAVDTIVQRDTDDIYRGRAFALYDVLYNAAFVGAAALGALTLPDTGYSQGALRRPGRGVRGRCPGLRPGVAGRRLDGRHPGTRHGVSDDLPLRSVLDSDLALSIADARAPDVPLIWVNEAFTRLTGYPVDEVVGRNCRFLQGAETDPTEVARIRTALDEGRTIATVIRNYRRDGSSFWNQVVISPVFDEAGTTTHFIGVQALARRATCRPSTRATSRSSLDDQATARLDLLARVSDELARNLDYDAAVDALGDIAIPALATWGFVAMTDERGRFSRVHLVIGDPTDRELALRLANEDLGWLYARAQRDARRCTARRDSSRRRTWSTSDCPAAPRPRSSSCCASSGSGRR